MNELMPYDEQFNEFYKDNQKVSPVVTQLRWTNH